MQGSRDLHAQPNADVECHRHVAEFSLRAKLHPFCNAGSTNIGLIDLNGTGLEKRPHFPARAPALTHGYRRFDARR